MAQKEVDLTKRQWIINFYVNEINFFEKETTELLLKTIIHETKIEKMKKQNLRVSEEDIDELVELIAKCLKSIAIVDTYEYFFLLEIPPTQENNELFYAMRERQFEKLLIVFLLKVKTAQEKEKTEIDFIINQ